MLTVIDNTLTKGTHIEFRLVGTSESGKTRRYEVVATEDNSLLGQIKWFSHWRKYVFIPFAGSAYEEVCLGEISEFIQAATRNHRLNSNKLNKFLHFPQVQA